MSHPARHTVSTLPVGIRAGEHFINADLAVPDNARGIVLFAHGSGSSRLSRRHRAVAAALQSNGIATLLVDLLTPDEEAQDIVTREHRFDIDLLASRLVAATHWLVREPRTRILPVGYFGASTGAAAALIAAAQQPDVVRAVVSRGGRPDLAGKWLRLVHAPTLLIVGGDDPEVLELNRQARRELRAPCTLIIVPGATHLFEEPGTMQEVTVAAIKWFTAQLTAAPCTYAAL
jgi:putative phosphoribosyl transferase